MAADKPVVQKEDNVEENTDNIKKKHYSYQSKLQLYAPLNCKFDSHGDMNPMSRHFDPYSILPFFMS